MIGLSDSRLMGLLAILGHDPISDKPRLCGRRCWWWFDNFEGKVREICLEYFSDWNGKKDHFAIIRMSHEMSKGFCQMGYEKTNTDFSRNPSTLRRL